MVLADAERGGTRVSLHEAALASLSNQIVVVDRQGTVIAVNAAWTESGGLMAIAPPGTIGPGASYVEVCRRAAAGGSPEAAAALEGIEAVCGGASALFETAYRCHAPGEERWCLMTVAPLRRPEGGAVISHADVTRPAVMELARRVSERRFRHLADTVPVPVWIVAPDGSLMYGNQAWVDATSGTSDRAAAGAGWLEAAHPDDRDAAMSAFRSAASRCERFEFELRLQAAHGSYRWWSFAGAPQLPLNGRLEGYVGICIDASEGREMRRSLDEVRAKLVVAQEAERSRIARELHDDIGQQLALAISHLEAVTRRGQLVRNQTGASLREARQGLQELATSIHNLSHELHPAKLRLLGLGPTLGALCRRISAESGTDITFTSEGLSSDLAEDRVLCIFRVAQEALRNAVAHSGARSIGVHLSGTASQLILRITDDGAGFDPIASRSPGLGLLTMRERVELMGGRLSIETRRAGGTTIEASIPTSGSASSL
jgi:PAS domain S-box-containing protein